MHAEVRNGSAGIVCAHCGFIVNKCICLFYWCMFADIDRKLARWKWKLLLSNKADVFVKVIHLSVCPNPCTVWRIAWLNSRSSAGRKSVHSGRRNAGDVNGGSQGMLNAIWCALFLHSRDVWCALCLHSRDVWCALCLHHRDVWCALCLHSRDVWCAMHLHHRDVWLHHLVV